MTPFKLVSSIITGWVFAILVIGVIGGPGLAGEWVGYSIVPGIAVLGVAHTVQERRQHIRRGRLARAGRAGHGPGMAGSQ